MSEATSTTPLFPEIRVKLTGRDGNAFGIIGSVSKALRQGGVSTERVSAFTTEAMSGDYDNVLRTATRWVSVR